MCSSEGGECDDSGGEEGGRRNSVERIENESTDLFATAGGLSECELQCQ